MENSCPPPFGGNPSSIETGEIVVCLQVIEQHFDISD